MNLNSIQSVNGDPHMFSFTFYFVLPILNPTNKVLIKCRKSEEKYNFKNVYLGFCYRKRFHVKHQIQIIVVYTSSITIIILFLANRRRI